MKTILGKLTLISLVSISPVMAKYRYVIYTDEPSQQKAQEVAHYFRTTSPFNEFDMEVVVKSMSQKELRCESYPDAQRLVSCDTNYIQKKAMSENFDQAFVVSNKNYYGGSGGQVPVITSAQDSPVSMIAHEYMHLLGFCDEYEYTKEEADYYCNEDYLTGRVNLVEIKPRSSGYTSDSEARSAHSGQIPWFSEITSNTPISAGALGTPATHSQKIGLFQNSSCRLAAQKIYLWQPGGKNNIMLDLHAPIEPYENLLRKALASAGLKRKPFPPPPLNSRPCQTLEDQMPLSNKLIMDYEKVMRGLRRQ